MKVGEQTDEGCGCVLLVIAVVLLFNYDKIFNLIAALTHYLNSH